MGGHFRALLLAAALLVGVLLCWGLTPQLWNPAATTVAPTPTAAPLPTRAATVTPASEAAAETPAAETPLPESPLPTPVPTLSPVETPLPTERAGVYLPLIIADPPLLLDYGPKGLAGPDVFGLFGDDYDSYLTWAVAPGIRDARLVRTVGCVSDYHLYPENGGLNYQEQIIQAARADRDQVDGRVWLIFNEPDDSVAQCGSFALTGNPFDRANRSLKVRQDPAEAARRYSLVYDWIKAHDPRARVFAGGLLHLRAASTQEWWVTFLKTLDAEGALYKVEGVHVHSYPEWTTGGGCLGHFCAPEMAQALNAWYADFHVGQGLADRPIWITEIGAGDCNWYGGARWDAAGWLRVRDGLMAPVSGWFAGDARWTYAGTPTNPGYSAMFWFIPWWGGKAGEQYWCTFLEDGRKSGGVLTPLGEYWKAW